MKKEKEVLKVINIILVLIWMITVFGFSNQNGTQSTNTSQTVTKVVVKPILTEDEKKNKTIIKDTEKVIRKLAHYTIYTIGGALILNYAYSTKSSKKKQIIYSVLFGFMYAITDELHQYFISERSARIFDVCIDTLGVITGILIYSVIREHIQTLKKHKSKTRRKQK